VSLSFYIYKIAKHKDITKKIFYIPAIKKSLLIALEALADLLQYCSFFYHIYYPECRTSMTPYQYFTYHFAIKTIFHPLCSWLFLSREYPINTVYYAFWSLVGIFAIEFFLIDTELKIESETSAFFKIASFKDALPLAFCFASSVIQSLLPFLYKRFYLYEGL